MRYNLSLYSRLRWVLLAGTMAVTCGGYAAPGLPDSHWQMFGGLGYAEYSQNKGNSRLQVTSIETDTLYLQRQKYQLNYLLGMQRVMPLQQRWLSGVALGLSVYYQPVSFSGEVYQYEAPLLNNYTYRYRAKPVNGYVEADFLLPRLAQRRLTPYVVLGAGLSAVQLSYQETAMPGIPPESAKAVSGWKYRFAAEVGAGIELDLTAHSFASARYVYQYVGKVDLQGEGMLNPISVNLNSHTGYLSFGYRFA